jgi:hypothetical protein
MTDLEALYAVRALLSVPERWTQYASARDRDGYRVVNDYDGAACWCLGGAIDKVARPSYRRICELLEAELPPRVGTIIQFNDDSERSHADILALIDRAIARLEGE